MRNIINYFVIGVLVVLSSFYLFCVTSFASALPTYNPIPEGWTVLDGEQQQYFEFGFTPEASVFGFLNAYDHLNQDLYNAYGWDLQDAQIYAQDWLTDDSTLWNSQNSLVNSLTNGQIASVSDAIQQGYTLFRYTLPSFVNSTTQGLSTWFMGKISEGTNNITNIFSNTFVPINDDFINTFSEQYDNLSEDNVIDNLTEKNVYYGKNFTFIDNSSSTGIYHIETNYDVYYFWTKSVSATYSNHYVSVFAPKSMFNNPYGSVLEFPQDFLKSSTYFVQNGTVYTPSEAKFNGYNDYTSININGVDYVYGNIWLKAGSNQSHIVNTSPMMEKETFLDWIQGNLIVDDAISYNWSKTDTEGNAIDIKELIEDLKGHYVTTDQLKELIDNLNDIPVRPNFYPNPEPNGDPLVLPDRTPTPDQWGVLENNIRNIINDALVTDPYFDPNLNPDAYPDPSPTPDPDPEPSPSDFPTGIRVPEDFPTDIFTPFTDVLKLPFSFLSVFEPIFYMFNHSLLFPLWLLVPCFIVICFIIWALK